MSDPLIAPFAGLCGALRGLHEQVERLACVHDAIEDFNAAFGSFQGAMALHASCLTYPKNVPAPEAHSLPKDKNLMAPGISNSLQNISQASLNRNLFQNKQNLSLGSTKSEEMDGKPKQLKKKPSIKLKSHAKVDSNNHYLKRRKAIPKTAPPAWTWDRHIREKIPRKYQSPAELKKLENIVLYLKNRHCAISISDLVKHSGLPVIRCKEILQTLMKLSIIERKREKAGFLYSFGSAE
ncbi:hypothetical protein CCR75_004265 [Bremia lactucae]|uniref:DASH complex subunit DAM1 n=1 Tax=Bremia lactucae TaxID=4779 RepID=A0A976IJU4_BRELC|nr:hypothetical protein CCR75_004265 [Bremia lactucae]